jgi:hypothetical protein
MKKLLLLLIVLGGLALATKPANAQNCYACDKSTAQCVKNSYGGCGCISRYFPKTHTTFCAACGFCLLGCTYPCGNIVIPGPVGTIATSQGWMANAALSSRVAQQSPHMGELLDVVRSELAPKGCTNWRGHMNLATGESVDWSMLVVKNGTFLMIDNPDGTHEKLSLTNKSWFLTKDKQILATEKLF